MPSTYSGDPAADTPSFVRYLIGDTGHDVEFFLTDAEIAFEIAQSLDVQNGNAERPYWAAIGGLERIIMRVAQRVDVQDGDARKANSALIDNFEKALALLTAQVTKIDGVGPYGYVPSLAGRVGRDTGPYFGIGMQDDPEDQTTHVDPPDMPGTIIEDFIPSIGGSAP